ncbi:Beta-lactamase domain-containing protein [Desulfonema limicola]|uniref:Beta-lactamase domain-containing protein n=1 Tax=Desulfonema limicola TaxID=45656 RepID=A0A975BAF5_9BACT|nr:hypothetical protein [Desulfonema limicola]QTA81662.1 Beta-lactamase domain-containing protein [Desulfonema limicola]
MKFSRFTAILITIFILVLPALPAWAYPLDGEPYTGIGRLEGYLLAQEGKARAPRQPPGAMLSIDKVCPRLTGYKNIKLPNPDPGFTAQIKKLLGHDAGNYGIAVLDISNPENIRYAEHRGTIDHNPGSVGKLVAATALFQILADIYPDDIEARLNILRTSMVTADRFINTDSHKVPLWSYKKKKMTYRPLKTGDKASLYTYLDWMMSASSNASASMVIREILLLTSFKYDYPVKEEKIAAFFKETPKKELSELLSRSLQEPLIRNGFDIEQFRQGGFFTWQGKQIVPGTSSRANARSLMQFLLLIEQGKIVDEFSSREIKRLLYMTQRRIRYASSPALNNAAVYFKSGSLYKCKPEPGFKCSKYRGNVRNLMNSAAIVEFPANDPRLHYMVIVMSNVLRKNSAVEHQTLGTRIHRLIESNHLVNEKSLKNEAFPKK